MKINESIDSFLNEKEFIRLSPATLENYRIVLSEFEEYLKPVQLEYIEEISKAEINDYIRYCLKTKGNTPNSTNAKFRRLNVFFNWCFNNQLTSNNPCKSALHIKETESELKVFTQSEVEEIISYLNWKANFKKIYTNKRNRLIFIFLISTGLRVSELVKVKFSDLNLKEHYFSVYGKGGTTNILPLANSLVNELEQWKEYSKKHFKGEQKEFVFNSKTGEQMTDNSVKLFFKKLAKEMDFGETRVSAHSCRHYFAKTFLKNGGDLSTLSKLLRHSSLAITSYYLKWNEKELLEDNNAFNPLNNLKF